ncbi:hypothetical protein [Paraburkholderia sp. BL6669N2]|nr:hypothetical protein [Paraburkholderia sp. BL6669N2]
MALLLHKVARGVTLHRLRVMRSPGINPGFEQDVRGDVTGRIDLLAKGGG